MQKPGINVAGIRYQLLAVLVCLALAALMTINTQGAGDAMWFWYAEAYRNGARLYSQMHTALQPFFILLMAGWTSVVGVRLVPYELPSIANALILAFGFVLVLRESDWPDWQKAILLFGSFVFVILGHSYRFDDYHVVDESLVLYALWLLLVIGRPSAKRDQRRESWLVAALGAVCGLDFVTRVADGAALIVAALFSLLFLLRGRRKLTGLTVFTAVAVLVALLVIKLTHDSVSAYVSNSIFRAAGSKGGANGIAASPFLSFGYAVPLIRGMKRIALYIALLFATGWAVQRYWKRAVPYIVLLEFLAAAPLYLLLNHQMKVRFKNGVFYEFIVLLVTIGMYFVFIAVMYRFVRSKRNGTPWDRREVLVTVAILLWCSYAASAGGDPLMNYYSPVVFFLLLFPIVQPFRRYAVWVNPSFVTVLGLVGICGSYVKYKVPYSWQNYTYGRMFANRTVYHHPVYGTMYIDQDLLRFSERVCRDIGATPGQPGPELLSLPFPYPNYFCDTPPWHNYVQTFFDTAQRATVEQMMRELQTDPPHWIVYQRQLNIMVGSERLYNHHQPLAQRVLDSMIMGRLASGQWKLVDEVGYLSPPYWENKKDTDWYIIDTKP